MTERYWKVGELARQCGLTVRALHHYDRIGLMVPAAHTASGHRLYTESDVRRLYAILALRRLGLSLQQIARLLQGGDVDLRSVITGQRVQVRAEIAHLKRLDGRLALLAGYLDRGPVPPGQLIETMEVMSMHETYYTPDQRAQLQARAEAMGEEGLRNAERDWADLIAAFRTEFEAGTAPADPMVRALATRWQALIAAFTGGDDRIRQSLQTMYDTEGVQVASRGMVDPQLMAYVQQALNAGT